MDPDGPYKKFIEIGPKKVLENLLRGIYQHNNKVLAEAYLQLIAQEKAEESERFNKRFKIASISVGIAVVVIGLLNLWFAVGG